MKDMWHEDKFLFFLLLSILVSGILVVAAIVRSTNQWEEFKITHECEVVAKSTGSTATIVAPMISSNGGVGVGVGTSYEGPKTAWLCNDGITYWR